MSKSRKSILFRFAVAAFVAYIGVTLIGQQMQISRDETEYNSVSAQGKAQLAQNEQVQRLLATNNSDAFAENVARDKLDYVKPGERIFINATGN